MSLLVTFLARVPPGGVKNYRWSSSVLKLNGAGFLFGDYDLHVITPVRNEVPIEVSDQLATYAPDTYSTLLYTACPEGETLAVRWSEMAKRFSLFCYLEIWLSPRVFKGGKVASLVHVARFIEEQVARLKTDVRAEGFPSLSTPDVVFYLFGNDYEEFFRVVLHIRQLTLHEFANWLSVEYNSPNSPWIPLIEELESVGRRHHLCRSTYTVFGTQALERNPDRPLPHVPDTEPTRLRPVIYIATYPGHECDPRVFEYLGDQNQQRTSVTTGIFDLLHDVVGSGETQLTQRAVLLRTVTALYHLWTVLGPDSDDRPTILRTNTVLKQEGMVVWQEDKSHGRNTDRRETDGVKLKVDPTVVPWLMPSIHLFQGLLNAYHAATLNELTFPYVRSLKPALDSLNNGLNAHVNWLTEWDAKPYNSEDSTAHELELERRKREFEDTFADAVGRVQVAFSNRTYGTAHSLREEVVAHPGASFQKLFAVYCSISRMTIKGHRRLFGDRKFPEMLYTLGGMETAHSHGYFAKDEDDIPFLVLIEISGRKLLQPGLVIFPIIHELMHVLDYDTLNLPLAKPLLEEAAGRIAALWVEIRGEGSAELLTARIRLALFADYEFRTHRENATYQLARDMLDWCVDRSSYLARLLFMEQPVPGKGEMRLPPTMGDDLTRLDRLAARLDLDLSRLRREFKECRADIIAAFATEPSSFREALTSLVGATALGRTRVKVLDDVVGSIRGQPSSQCRPLVVGLAEIARQVIQHRDPDLVPQEDFFRTLTCDLSEMNQDQLSTLLSYCEDAT